MRYYLYKKHLPGVTELYCPHISNTFSLCANFKMPPTIKNHINPCFWTALWNKSYFFDFINQKQTKKPREQKVFSLDFRRQKIVSKKVDDVHFSEYLGVAFASGKEIVNSNMIFLGDDIYFPDTKRLTTIKEIKQEQNYLLDIESDFTSLEQIAGYEQLLKTVKNNKVESELDRIYLACFIVYHQLRSEIFFESLSKKYDNNSNPKLETILHFRNVISNTNEIMKMVLPIVCSDWNFYSTEDFQFPLNDCPIFYDDKKIWAIISPKHLLEIDTSKAFSGNVHYNPTISGLNFDAFKETLIRHTYKEIIFTDSMTLEELQNSPSYINRKSELGY